MIVLILKSDEVMKKYSGFIVFVILNSFLLSSAGNSFVKDAYAEKSFTCFSCGKKISGNHLVVGKFRLHPECFVCKGCGEIISGPFNRDGHDFYHPDCYKISQGLVCDYCGKVLKEQWTEFDGRKYHAGCYRENIQFRCGICGKVIEGRFRKDDEGRYHEDCYKNHKLEKCIICSLPIEGPFVTDAWGNHSHSEHDGIKPDICGSCGRIISKQSSEGGFILNDGRIVCGKCNKTAVTTMKQVGHSEKKVLRILAAAGLFIPEKHPVHLVDQAELSEIGDGLYNKDTKGFTNSLTKSLGRKIISVDHTVYILTNLAEIKFMGVLAHEFLHVWLNEQGIKLPITETEGFCNLGTMLVNKAHQEPVAKILQENLEKNPDPVYGDGYRIMKTKLDKLGWDKLIGEIRNSLKP